MIRTLLTAAILLVPGFAAAQEGCAADRLSARGDWGSARFAIEVADTAEARAQGLMFVESMPAMAGMLFVYDRPHRASFWMKNTLIPLDMIFIGADGVVRDVHAEAVPGDLTSISGGNETLAVLEVNGGMADRLGIAPGTEIRHPAFGADAAWACPAD